MMTMGLTHEQAIQMVHIGSNSLNAEQSTVLVEHLSECTECQEYATHLEVLEPLLHRAMSTRWDSVIPPGDLPGTLRKSALSSTQIASRFRRKTVQKRIFNLIGEAAGVVALLIVLFVAFNRLRPGQNLQTGMNSTVTVVPATTPEPTAKLSSTGRTDVITYTVQEGDTIYGIARQFNLQPESILWANFNALTDNTHILKPGMTINILPVDGVTHKWTAGESLLGIAKSYGVKPEDIVNWPGNHLDPNTLGDWSNPNIAPGTMLVIPGGHLDFTDFTKKQDSTNQQIDAINKIRAKLELPELPVEFVEMTHMINSPTGGLEVAVYQDTEGRKYSVEPKTNQVVEIDARSILSNIPPNASLMSEEELKAKAQKLISATIPDFETLKAGWMYEEGNKGDSYFSSWYGEIKAGTLNRPFAQIGLNKSGVLFAYYNTLLTNVPQVTSQAFRFGVPVESEANALIAAEAGLRTGFEYIEPFTVVKVEQMSYGEYIKQLDGSSGRPLDMKMWLVVYFDDKWLAKPATTGLTPIPPFRGCVSVAINAADGLLLEVGGPLQSGKITECDK